MVDLVLLAEVIVERAAILDLPIVVAAAAQLASTHRLASSVQEESDNVFGYST